MIDGFAAAWMIAATAAIAVHPVALVPLLCLLGAVACIREGKAS